MINESFEKLRKLSTSSSRPSNNSNQPFVHNQLPCRGHSCASKAGTPSQTRNHDMSYSLALARVVNFRDVGQTVNRYIGQKFMREGVLFRSARPDDASAEERALIKDDLGIRTIIDLRTKTELIKQARKFQQDSQPCSSSSSLLSWFSPPLGLPHIDGITYEEIKITGRPFERHLLSQLSWLRFFKVIVLFIFGRRVEAVRIIATEVMLPRGLLGLGIDTIDHSGAELQRALSLYTSKGSLPILVHCTQGKDRTGLIIILILMILGIPQDAIEHDYSLTDKALEAEKNERLAEVREIGLTDEWVATCPVMISGLQNHLDIVYGGLEDYLDGIGFDADLQDDLRDALLY